MLIRLQNASFKKHATVLINFNKLNFSILKILFSENLIDGYYIFFDKKNIKYIKVFLKYYGWWIKKPSIMSFNIIKKSEFLTYLFLVNKIKLKKLISKTLIISTSVGMLTLTQAINLKIGGKLICQIN